MSTVFFTYNAEGGSYLLTAAGYSLFIAVLIIAILLACFFSKADKHRFNTKQLVFSAAAVALAFVTAQIKLFHLPYGGSITLCSMFFICFVGWVYGLRGGLSAGLAFGILQMIIDPYVLSIPQLLCDYVFAFTALGLAGLFATRRYGLYKGYVIGIIGRFIFSTLSGVIFFSSYAPEGLNPILYSVIYNGIYIGTEGFITVVILLVPAVRMALTQVKDQALEN